MQFCILAYVGYIPQTFLSFFTHASIMHVAFSKLLALSTVPREPPVGRDGREETEEKRRKKTDENKTGE